MAAFDAPVNIPTVELQLFLADLVFYSSSLLPQKKPLLLTLNNEFFLKFAMRL